MIGAAQPRKTAAASPSDPNHRAIELTPLTGKEAVPHAETVGQIPVGKETVIRIELDQKGARLRQQEPQRQSRPLESLLSGLKPIPSRADADKAAAEQKEKEGDAHATRIRRQRKELIKRMLKEERESVLDLFNFKFIKQFH